MSHFEEFKFGNYIYRKDFRKRKVPFEIIHDKKRPESICKFYSLTKNSLESLEKGYFYASHPYDLNDILDSNSLLLYTSGPLGIGWYSNLFNEILEPLEIEEYFEQDQKDHCRGFMQTYWEVLINIFGIVSVSAVEKNLLMWPHYTQEKGFQLKFNTNELERSIKEKLKEDEEYVGLFPVNYCSELEPIDISAYKHMFIPLSYITNVKHKAWKYEKEWRFIIGKKNMGVPYSKVGFSPYDDYGGKKENRFTFYDTNAVEEITLGYNFFNRRDFQIAMESDGNFKVKVRKTSSSENIEQLENFMAFITLNFSEKLFCSSMKKEYNSSNKLILVRSKERICITNSEGGWYKLQRTNEVKVFMDSVE